MNNLIEAFINISKSESFQASLPLYKIDPNGSKSLNGTSIQLTTNSALD